MVSKAISVGLIERIQNYVANDINSKLVMAGSDEKLKIKPEDVYILDFTRVLNTWQATATAEEGVGSFYKIVHDGDTEQTIVTIYIIHGYPFPGII